MIASRVRDALSTIPKRDHCDLHKALANVVAAAEFTLTCKGTTHVADDGVPSLEQALAALDERLKECE